MEIDKSCWNGSEIRYPKETFLNIDPSENCCDFYDTDNRNPDDSGFDLYTPRDTVIPAESVVIVDMEIRCNMVKNGKSIGYYVYARSSISKTPLQLNNSVGVIDAGYRGTIKVALRNMSKLAYRVEKGSRLVQICAPTLASLYIQRCSISEDETTRGGGAFGSTGK